MRLLIIFLLLSSTAFSQGLVKGTVKDAEKGQPLAGASIFLSNTSIGTTSNSEGYFELRVPAGRYDLVVSSIGYETYAQSLNAASLQAPLQISLNHKAAMMETVVIESVEKNGWEKWGRFFTDHFIGTSALAGRCKIKNPEVLRFRNSKQRSELSVTALEPLIIENKALGYNVRYQLEQFSFNFNTRLLLFTGFPLFEELKGGKGKQREWEEKRKEVYTGSMMHFMRSIYRNKLQEEGFVIRRLEKFPNTEKKRVKELYRAGRIGSSKATITITADSSRYYESVLRQEDEKEVIGQHLLAGDSIAFAFDSVTAGLQFSNYLLVHYPSKEPPAEYQMLYPKNGRAMLSQLKLLNEQPVEIHANGMYYDPVNLLSLGYWAWAEKIATMLPFDYVSE